MWLLHRLDLTTFIAGPEGFEPSTPGLEGRCFGPDDIILHRSIQTELRAHLADYNIAFLEFWLENQEKENNSLTQCNDNGES